jgi:hypothetical protein
VDRIARPRGAVVVEGVDQIARQGGGGFHLTHMMGGGGRIVNVDLSNWGIGKPRDPEGAPAGSP